MSSYKGNLLRAEQEILRNLQDHQKSEVCISAVKHLISCISINSGFKTSVPQLAVVPAFVSLTFDNISDEFRIDDSSLTIKLSSDDTTVSITAKSIDNEGVVTTVMQNVALTDIGYINCHRFAKIVSLSEMPEDFDFSLPRYWYTAFLPDETKESYIGTGMYNNKRFFYKKMFTGEITRVSYYYIYEYSTMNSLKFKLGLALDLEKPVGWMKSVN